MYGFSVQISGGFEDAVQRVTEALKEQGFGIISDIDVRATMKEKLGIESQPYRILGACNPSVAHRALQADPDIGLLLPCNVVVRQASENTVTVSFMDPEAVLSLVNHNEIEELGNEVRQRLEKVRDALK
ncbi:MAG TPA: DUF302 domain-containing protein [Acidobacteriota bacterium]|nr:DUF302 domain-containing protein [Acidobacteriota bacterium]